MFLSKLFNKVYHDSVPCNKELSPTQSEKHTVYLIPVINTVYLIPVTKRVRKLDIKEHKKCNSKQEVSICLK